MAENSVPTEESPGAVPAARLDSWKEIAAYLKRDVTTVRRWERREALPVHRHLHQRRDSVYAYTSEIDFWWKGRGNHLADSTAFAGVTNGGVHAPAPFAGETSSRSWGPGGPGRAWTLVISFAAATLTLGGLLALGFPRAIVDERREVRFSIHPPEHTSFGTMSLSPDGRRLAFTATSNNGKTVIWIRPLDTLEARPLPETDGATLPFWSPDSNAIGFFAAGKLWTADLSGGSPRVVTDAPEGRGGTWSQTGIIVFAPGRSGPLFRVPATGGPPAAVTAVERTERGHLWPQFLPDGERFLYLADGSELRHHNLFVGSLNGDARTRLSTLASSAAYAEGYLLFERERRLVAQPFDDSRLAFAGDPVTLAEHVVQPWNMDHKTEFAVSNHGLLIFRSLGGFDTQLVWRDRSESQSVLVSAPAGYSDPTFSPDQTWLAVDVFDSRPSKRFGFGVTSITSDIWLVNRTSGARSQFTLDAAADFDPVWSPDGRHIVFSSSRRGTLDLYQKRSDGIGSDEVLLTSPLAKHAQDWSPDGRFLVYAVANPDTRFDLWLLPMVGDRMPIPFAQSGASEQQAQISPDSRWIAYTSDESGRSQVYVQRFPTPGDKVQISPDGGGDAQWRADGSELFFIAENRRLMAVPVKVGATFERGEAMPLFDTGMQPHWGTSRNHYDVSRDGQRFLLMAPVADDRSSPFTIVVNWADNLRK